MFTESLDLLSTLYFSIYLCFYRRQAHISKYQCLYQHSYKLPITFNLAQSSSTICISSYKLETEVWCHVTPVVLVYNLTALTQQPYFCWLYFKTLLSGSLVKTVTESAKVHPTAAWLEMMTVRHFAHWWTDYVLLWSELPCKCVSVVHMFSVR